MVTEAEGVARTAVVGTAAGTAAATAAVAAAATAAAAAAATDPAEKATDTRDVSKDDLCTDRDLGVRKEGVRGQHTTGPGHPGGRRAPRGPGTQYGQLRRGGTPSQLAILKYGWSELGTFNGQPAGPETPLLISEGMLPRVLGIEFPQQGSERECKVVQDTTHRANGK